METPCKSMMHYEDWEWWAKHLHNYADLDSLTDKEAKRTIFCCLEFIVKALEPKKRSLS